MGKSEALAYIFYNYLFPKHPLTLLCIDLGQTTQAEQFAHLYFGLDSHRLLQFGDMFLPKCSLLNQKQERMTRLRAGRKQPPKEDNPERSSIQRGALPMGEEHSDGISDIPVTRTSTRG